MEKRSIKLMLLLVTMVLFIFTACGGNKSSDTTAMVEKRDEIVFANFRDIRDLNPHNYAGEMYAQNLLYEGLVKIDTNGKVIPWLAEKYEVSEDGKEYTFFLRKDVTFSDGEKFDAHAVEANFKAILDNKDRHGWLESIRLYDGMEVVDDYTFKWKLKEAYFPMLIEFGVIRPFRFISPKAFKDGTTKGGVNAYIGTGAYVLKSNTVDQEAIFERNDNYWGKKPEVKTVRVKVIPDNQTRALSLEKGDLDLLFGKNMIDAETFLSFQNKEGYEVHISAPLSTRMMIINTTKGALTETKVRQALQHVLDKKAIAESIFNGTETPADTVLAESVPYANLGLKPYEYSLETAAKLLDEPGWLAGTDGKRTKEGKNLDISLYYNADSVSEKAISEYFQQQLAQIGINMKIFGEEEQSYRDRMKNGDFDISFNISWGTPYDPQSFLGGMRKPVYGDYAAQLGLPEKAQIDDDILRGLKTTSEEERQKLFGEVLTILHEEAVYIPITYETNKAINRKDLKGVDFEISAYEIPFYDMYY